MTSRLGLFIASILGHAIERPRARDARRRNGRGAARSDRAPDRRRRIFRRCGLRAGDQAHIMADTESLGVAGVEWLESLEAQVRIPTITDPRGTDFAKLELLKQ